MAKTNPEMNTINDANVSIAAKTVTITFGSEADLQLYNTLKTDADKDDRTISLFILRYLRGYEAD